MRSHRDSGIALLTALLIMLMMSSLMVGFMLLLMTDRRLTTVDRDHSQAFYGAEAGMEKLTADLGTLFNANYAPSGTQINNLTTSPPNIPGISYVDPKATSGYRIGFTADNNGNPVAQNATILSGPYQGLIGELTHYTLTVTSRTLNGSEVKLQRYIQTVGVPVFQFGVFSQTDLSFFAGPNFNFGGRVHTNGNIFLAEGNGNTLTMADRVTAVGEVIRTNLSNGWNNSTNYTGTANILTAPNTYRALGSSEGSLVGTLGSAINDPTWHNLSLGTYNGNIRNGRTGAKTLSLPLVTFGGQTVDLIRRPVQNEDTTNISVLAERYFAQASIKILLSDDKNDIMNLPCIDTTTQPVGLSTLAVPTTATLPAWYTAGMPLAVSGAGNAAAYTAADGYWIQPNKPIITGFLKIEIQTAYAVPCGTWKDVTQEILNLGVAGRNLYPLTAPAAPALPALPAAQQAPSACAYASPNAVLRFERVRDNPSNGGAAGGCGVGGGAVPPLGTDYWPLVFFDTREGIPRDTVPAAPNNVRPTLGGLMHYVELDLNNLGRWFSGTIGASGTQAKDSSNSTHNFVVYFSDRRSNYTATALPVWPPASPTTHETGEYGFEDFLNPSNANGCPNGSIDGGEDVDGLGTSQPLQTYGQAPVLAAGPYMANIIPGSLAIALTANPNCVVAAPSAIWPGTYVTNARDARENPPLFFRRALKLVNGSSISLGSCSGSVPCGLDIASENPVYAEGNLNASGSFTGTHTAVAILADAFTFLSNNWNDINSFIGPYSPSKRGATTTWYRAAIVAGKGISFPKPTGYATYQDYGTDGGVHNFLRFIENWGGQTLNYRGSIVSLFFNRQATGVYKCCTTVYSPPGRGYNFDVEFLQPNLLPPRTPMFRDVNTTGFTQLIMAGQ